MEKVEQTVEKACTELDIPGCVFLAGNTAGSFQYAKAFGLRTLKDLSKPEPMDLDTTMWVASCTKLMTAVACMQCVEKGLLTLDGDISEICPEFKGVQILTGFDDDGKPVLVDNDNPITLRHLLTHTSGLAYDVFDPLLMRWSSYVGNETTLSKKGHKPLSEAIKFPLLFTPGTSWTYGVGLDWAGIMVERVNGNITLDAYLQKNVWDPLGIKNFTFFPLDHPDVLSRLAELSWRDGDLNRFGAASNPDAKVVYTTQQFFAKDTKYCEGGAGGHGPPAEYFKLLQSILRDDGKLLKSETIDEMFTPQLGKQSQAQLTGLLTIPEMNSMFEGLPKGTRVSYGMSGIINLDDTPGRKAGSMAWGGYPNLKWWIDRKTGVCGMSGAQIAPPGDRKMGNLHWMWEEEVYRQIEKQQKL